MSWRVLFVLVVLMLGASAAAGIGVGNWLVDQAPTISADARTNTTRPPEIVRDAAGRPLAAIPPQPLLDGSLGQPMEKIQPMWEVQAVSLFESNLDPMVVLGRGDQSYTVSDMLSGAGAGLGQGEADVAMVDLTAAAAPAPSAQEPVQVAQAPAVTRSWDEQLADAIDACDNVGFFSRPGCIERARKKFCDPNRAWGRHPLCPSTNNLVN
ncbi:hypothetical protein [Orrella daihaiensis]|uniref:Uncharacterized protein n=1 Tax=Orrella daihaiensis TaxID=2782176 RepID=A0ABY4ANC0_9BURK|nr:hypothetical protein [Orrella daihaiensis]UOD50557.1 hypothetical protein DHf2319_01040 [Orrella daihaiensis]